MLASLRYSCGNVKMWVFTILFLIKLFASISPLGLEEYILNVDSPIYVCPDEESQAFLDTSEVETRRHNETHCCMFGNITFLKQFEDQTMLEIIIDKEEDGNLYRKGTHDICDVCKEISDPNSFYKHYFQYYAFAEKCPFEAGSYPIYDLVADMTHVPTIIEAIAGRYQVTMNFYKSPSADTCKSGNGRTFIACLKFYVLMDAL